MAEQENACQGCENNCCEDFKLYWPREDIEKLQAQYPFFRVVGTDVGLVGGREKVYRIMKCDRLKDDGSCQDYPVNRPAFCENTGVKARPAIICKLHDLVGQNKI